MTGEFPGYYEFQRNGELIQFTARLEGGCTIFSVQKFHEAWERKTFPEVRFPFYLARKRKRNA
jgi:hypothetical protein